MTTPPVTCIPLLTSGPPASAFGRAPPSNPAPDFNLNWTAMPPQHNFAAQLQQGDSNNPPTTAHGPPSSAGDLVFITSGTPAGFKNRENMTTVRRTAMGSVLRFNRRKNGRSRSPGTRSGSNESKSTTGNDDAVTNTSTIPTAVSQNAGSSPRSSAAQLSSDQAAPAPISTVAKIQRPRTSILPSAPIVLPSRNNVPLPYDAYVPPPFRSIGESLDPFQTMFQSSHPHVSVEELKHHCSAYFGTRALGKYWIPTALSYPHTFLGTLCLATAFHDVIHEEPFESLRTIALRQEVIHLIGRNMLSPEARVSDHNIMAVIQLIISEVIGREEFGLSYHEKGLETMITQRGGLNQLGLHGRLASSISWVSLATSVLREKQPRPMYADYCAANSRKIYPLTTTIPESPIYCPHGTFSTLKRSSSCTQKARDLIDDVRCMIDFFLHETRTSRRNSTTLMNYYRKITSPTDYPPISELFKLVVLTQDDWKYEAIRLAATIQATAIIKRLPLSDTLKHAAELLQPSAVNIWAPATSTITPLISPFDQHLDPQTTEQSINLPFSPYPTNLAVPQSYFSTSDARSSMSSGYAPYPSFSSESSATHPSISSTYSAATNVLEYFPRQPPPPPSESTNLLQDLRTAIGYSNISSCWDDMGGVLLWICLVAGAASETSDSKIHKKFFSALTMRTGVLLCFEHPEAINSTMSRMTEVVEALGAGHKTVPVARGQESGKKRRF